MRITNNDWLYVNGEYVINGDSVVYYCNGVYLFEQYMDDVREIIATAYSLDEATEAMNNLFDDTYVD